MDIEIEHTLPAGAVIKPTFDFKKMILKPGEEKTVTFSLYVPKHALSPLRPPFDGTLEGKLWGELCGPIKGNLSEVQYNGKTKLITALIAGTIQNVGSVNGRFTGSLERKSGKIEGRAEVSFQGKSQKSCTRIRITGVKGHLTPVRVVNFAQLVKNEPVGGITVPLVMKKK